MTDQDAKFQRQLDFLKTKVLASIPIHIVGAGAIGGWTALALAKMGAHNLTTWDPDSFEIHNVPNQFCMEKHVGISKVQAVEEMIAEFEPDCALYTEESLFTGDVEPGAIVISAVDSMKARIEIWRRVKDLPIRAYIDPRMGLTMIEMYAFTLPDSEIAKGYKETLWEDDEVAPVRCTAKTTIFTAMNVAGLVARVIAMIAREEEEKIPFCTMLDLDTCALMLQDKDGKVTN